MPIHECDPWREQYFTDVHCPSDVHIPTDDVDGYKFNPRHRWIYNRLRVAQSQGLECGLNDAAPPRYPVFCKPVTNLKGMGAGTSVLETERSFLENCRSGDFWMRLLTGEHISSDWAVVEGDTAWCRHTHGIPGVGGTFDHWIIEARVRRRLERYCRAWIRSNLPDYTGMVNIETIGGRWCVYTNMGAGSSPIDGVPRVTASCCSVPTGALMPTRARSSSRPIARRRK